MKANILLIVSCGLAVSSSVFAQVTALNNGSHKWTSSEWTSGVPTSGGTAFLNDNTILTIDEGDAASVKGIRIGNVTSSITTLELLGGSLSAEFIVVANSVTANANFYQLDGSLTITDTVYTDFMLGSPEGTSISPCFTMAVFEGGSASLADVVFNLSANRNVSFTVDGSRVDLSAKSISAVSQGDAPIKATIEFTFDRRGISPLKILDFIRLGEGDQIDLKIDGSDYTGRESRFVLIDSPSLIGEFGEIVIEGFKGGASVYADGTDIILTIP